MDISNDTYNEFPFLKVGDKVSHRFLLNEKERWIKLRKEFGPLWKYYNEESNPIYYNFNELGYRSKHVLPYNDYFIAIGCSSTFGLNLHENERYSNVIENNINIPVINLGFNGGSANYIMMNICKLLSSNYNLPSAMFIQWPEIERLNIPQTKSYYTCQTIRAASKVYGKVFETLIRNSNAIQTLSMYSKDTIVKLLKKFNIKNINFSLNEELSEFYQVPCINHIDKARDNKHAGTKTNKNIAEYILNEL